VTAASSSPRAAWYAAAEAWRIETARQARDSVRTAWLIASLAVVAALAQTAALVALQPLASPSMIGVEIDRAAGPAQARQALRRGPLSVAPALLQSEIARYVACREGLDPVTFAFDHRAVVLASSGSARAGYISDWAVGGPRHAGATVATRIVARVTGVTLTGPGTAFVRYETRTCEGANPCGPPMAREAQLSFVLSDAPAAPRDRLGNPLGVIVTDYRS
jgi:type IV secretion system protein VirB8